MRKNSWLLTFSVKLLQIELKKKNNNNKTHFLCLDTSAKFTCSDSRWWAFG